MTLICLVYPHLRRSGDLKCGLRAAILTNVFALVSYITNTSSKSLFGFLSDVSLLFLLGKSWWSRSCRLPRNEGLSSALAHKYLHSVYITVDLWTLAETIIYTCFLSFQGDQGIRGDKVKETELPGRFHGHLYQKHIPSVCSRFVYLIIHSGTAKYHKYSCVLSAGRERS